jgi:4-oxalocrotonate tautomerase
MKTARSAGSIWGCAIGYSFFDTMPERFATASHSIPKIAMPYINIQITQGATREQKSQLVKEVTDSLVRILGKKPEHTHIVIQEIAEENWGFAGMLTDDWKKQQ